MAGSGASLHGFLNIDKPPHLTSFDVVRAVRRAAGTRRVGHTGTLDPIATGVLPLAVGEATAASNILPRKSRGHAKVAAAGWAADRLP